MRQRNLNVDAQTFGSLALGCERQKDGLQLLEDMEVMTLCLLHYGNRIDVKDKIQEKLFYKCYSLSQN